MSYNYICILSNYFRKSDAFLLYINKEFWMRRRKKRQYKPRFFIICGLLPCIIVGAIAMFVLGLPSFEVVYETQEKLPENAQKTIETFVEDTYGYMGSWKDTDLTRNFSDEYEEEGLVCQSAYDLLIEMRELRENDLRFDIRDVVLTITDIKETAEGFEVQLEEAYSCKFKFMDKVSETQGVACTMGLVKEGNKYKLSGYTREEDFYSYITEGYEYGNGNPKETLNGIKKVVLTEFHEQLEKLEVDKHNVDIEDVRCDVAYDREAAREYALKHALTRNDDRWYVFDDLGGNCQNFGSQVIYTGGVPMDLKGDAVWKFFDVEPDESGKKTGRSTSWTGVTYFYDYAKANTGFGLCAKVDANVFSAEAGDIMQVGDGTGDFVHTIVSLGAITDKDGNIIDINTVSNTTDRKNYPMSAYNCPYIRLIKIYGYNN